MRFRKLTFISKDQNVIGNKITFFFNFMIWSIWSSSKFDDKNDTFESKVLIQKFGV